MKKYLKILLLLNLAIIPSSNLISCTYSEGGGTAYFAFSSSIHQTIETNVFSSEDELLEEVKEIAKDIEFRYSMKVYENPTSNDLQLNKDDIGYTLKFEKNFFEINKKEINILIIETTKQNEEYVWKFRSFPPSKKEVTFNLTSNILGIKGEGEHIEGSTLRLKNDGQEKQIEITSYLEHKNLRFKVFFDDGRYSDGSFHSSKGEWKFEHKSGILYFRGLNNSIPDYYNKLRIIEKVKDNDYRWFDLTLKGTTDAEGLLYVSDNKEESKNVKIVTGERDTIYQVYKNGKLIIDIENLIITMGLEEFDFLWDDYEKFEEIKEIKKGIWKLTIDYKVHNSLRTLKIIPKDLKIIMRFLKVEFIDETLG